MSNRYEHEILDGSGAKHPFSLTVEGNGASGELVWPAETSKLEAVRRVSDGSITALIVWTTMNIRCWINAAAGLSGTDLKIIFAMTPYRYRIEDSGAFVTFLTGLALPHAAAEDLQVSEQSTPAGGSAGVHEAGSSGAADIGPSNCGNQVKVEDRSDNQQYAYYYLVNTTDEDAGVTILKSWMYEGKERTRTERHDLYPGQAKEVFSFPRAQSPKCRITHCRLG